MGFRAQASAQPWDFGGLKMLGDLSSAWISSALDSRFRVSGVGF